MLQCKAIRHLAESLPGEAEHEARSEDGMNDSNLPKIVIRHISGSKANQIEEFTLDGRSEIRFGRDPS